MTKQDLKVGLTLKIVAAQWSLDNMKYMEQTDRIAVITELVIGNDTIGIRLQHVNSKKTSSINLIEGGQDNIDKFFEPIAPIVIKSRLELIDDTF